MLGLTQKIIALNFSDKLKCILLQTFKFTNHGFELTNFLLANSAIRTHHVDD